MFFKYLEPIIQPFRDARNRWIQAKQMKGNFQMDVKRVQGVRDRAQKAVGMAAGKAGAVKGRVNQAGAQVGKAAQSARKTAPNGQNGVNATPGIRIVGWFRKRHVCQQCGQQLDKTWDSCPYCAQGPARTQAFMVDQAGAGAPVQLLGWVVPVAGPHRGELYTLAPVSIVGTDPTCHVVLHDQYMSGEHAEIKAEGGVWILRDLGSTNGTFVNDHRVDQRELVDNDFVKFGQCLVKFKSL